MAYVPQALLFVVAVLTNVCLEFMLVAPREVTTELKQSSVVWYIGTITTLIPAVICLTTVLGCPTHTEQYPKWVSVGLVWCIAGDILRKVPPSEDSSEESLQLIVLLAYSFAAFALMLGFSAGDEDDDEDGGPELHLETGIPIMGAMLALFYQLDQGDPQRSAQAIFLGLTFTAVWRASARLGYGLKGATVYGSLPQWMGLLGMCAMCVSFWMLVCEYATKGPMMPFDEPQGYLVRMLNYWIGLVCIVFSVTMGTRPF